MIHHKACHREWQPDFKYLEEYEDVTFPIPDTFYDDYEGRIAAQQQEMTIEHEMRLVADNKLIHFYDDIDSWELFDLKNDPNELDNLYGRPEYAGVVTEMVEELKRLQEQYQDPISI